jgi:biofilm PGA synthesis lipoprotein PgaB
MSTPTQAPPRKSEPPTPEPPRRPGLIRRALASLLSLALIAVVLVLPAVWQWRTSEQEVEAKNANIVEQVTSVKAGPLDPALVERLRAAPASAQAAPVILTYHNVGYSNSEYSVTPESFATQMELLAEAGWTTITAAQLEGWLAGQPLPSHSVLVTFDDGVRGVWQYADQILARHQQHAVAFIITGFVGTSAPYYMTWPEITALHNTGRWDIEAHTHVGHGQVQIDAAGNQGPFLTSLRYLPEQRRMETLEEYQNRIRADLVECKRQLALHGMGDAALFAYPFSAHAGTPESSAALSTEVRSLFHAAMLDEAGEATSTTSTDLTSGNLGRMDITSDVTPAVWVDRMLAANPHDPASSAPFVNVSEWATSDGTPATLPVQAGRLLLDPGPGAYIERSFAPTGTSMWRSYDVDATLTGFHQIDDGATPGLIVLDDDPQQIELSLNVGSYQIRQGVGGTERVLAEGKLAAADAYPVHIAVRPDAVTLSVSGRAIGRFGLSAVGGRPPAGGIALSANRYDEASPVPVIADLSTH